MSDDLVKRLRFGSLSHLGSSRMNLEAADSIEALTAAIDAALERLDASLFTNAEHQQAKDILRKARNHST